jgi:prepilin-type processing-associated H-X9-DG protein
LIGEAAGNFRPWGHPANVRNPALGIGRSRDGFGGPPGSAGAQFLMCDGSVRMISRQTDLRVLRELATPAGDESVALEVVGKER